MNTESKNAAESAELEIAAAAVSAMNAAEDSGVQGAVLDMLNGAVGCMEDGARRAVKIVLAELAESSADVGRLRAMHRFHDDSSVQRWKTMVKAVSEHSGALVGLLEVDYTEPKKVRFVVATPGDETDLATEFVRLMATAFGHSNASAEVPK